MAYPTGLRQGERVVKRRGFVRLWDVGLRRMLMRGGRGGGCNALRSQGCGAMLAHMLNVISILIGIVALILGVLAFFPLLGWAYWVIVPLALIGLAFGQLSSGRGGRNLNLIVIVIGIVRLVMGGGLV
jgi:hypothetical protein